MEEPIIKIYDNRIELTGCNSKLLASLYIFIKTLQKMDITDDMLKALCNKTIEDKTNYYNINEKEEEKNVITDE